MNLRDTQEMADTTKIGPRVPVESWENFKRFTEEKHGKQGKAGEELTKAINEHMSGSEGEEINIESQLATINAKLDYIMAFVNEQQQSR